MALDSLIDEGIIEVELNRFAVDNLALRPHFLVDVCFCSR